MSVGRLYLSFSWYEAVRDGEGFPSHLVGVGRLLSPVPGEAAPGHPSEGRVLGGRQEPVEPGPLVRPPRGGEGCPAQLFRVQTIRANLRIILTAREAAGAARVFAAKLIPEARLVGEVLHGGRHPPHCVGRATTGF